MINYTTPTVTLTVEGIDITSYDVYATLEQGDKVLTKTDLTKSFDEDTTLTFMLTQEESASFDFNKGVFIQVNWITPNGVRAATGIKSIPVMRNLLDKVIEYGN